MDIKTGDIFGEDSLSVQEFVKDIKSGAPLIYKDKVYVGSPITKTFYAYDLQSDEKELSGTLALAGPIIINDTLFVASQDENVYAIPLEEIVYNYDKEVEKKNYLWILVGRILLVGIVFILYKVYLKRRL